MCYPDQCSECASEWSAFHSDPDIRGISPWSGHGGGGECKMSVGREGWT